MSEVFLIITLVGFGLLIGSLLCFFSEWAIVYLFRIVFIFGLVMSLSGIIGLSATEPKKPMEPQAIDVYRGNTTLEITYRDSIPVDSVVVFKNEKI